MHNHFTSKLLVFGVAASVLLGVAGSASAQEVKELLGDLAKRREALSSLHHVTRTVTQEGDTERETTVIRWERKTRDGRQVRVITKTRSRQKGGAWGDELETVMVNDGDLEWREMNVAGSPMVFKSKSANTDPLADVVDAVKSGQARIKGRESIAQIPCVVIEVAGRKELLFRAAYWISQEYGVVLQNEFKRSDRIQSEVRTIEVKVGERLSDDLFAYTPAPDAAVVDTEGLGAAKEER